MTKMPEFKVQIEYKNEFGSTSIKNLLIRANLSKVQHGDKFASIFGLVEETAVNLIADMSPEIVSYHIVKIERV